MKPEQTTQQMDFHRTILKDKKMVSLLKLITCNNPSFLFFYYFHGTHKAIQAKMKMSFISLLRSWKWTTFKLTTFSLWHFIYQRIFDCFFFFFFFYLFSSLKSKFAFLQTKRRKKYDIILCRKKKQNCPPFSKSKRKILNKMRGKKIL